MPKIAIWKNAHAKNTVLRANNNADKRASFN